MVMWATAFVKKFEVILFKKLKKFC
jgi:hypothetical protein